MSNEAGLEQPLEWTAWPPTWANEPTTALPRFVLRPWSGLWPIHYIFTYYAFHFEPN